jgi:hypothetical protein
LSVCTKLKLYGAISICSHHGLDVGAADGGRLQLAPARQHVAAHQMGALLPGLVFLPGVLVDVALGQLGKRAPDSLGLLLGRRVLPFGDGQHSLCGQGTGVAQANGRAITKMQPAWPAMAGIDHLPAPAARGLHLQRQTGLLAVPNEKRAGLWLHLPDKQLGELPLAWRPFGRGMSGVLVQLMLN